MTDILAVPGERLTCEAGHLIAIVARPIERGRKTHPDDFTGWRLDWIGKIPAAGDPFRRCACGGEYIRVIRSTRQAMYRGLLVTMQSKRVIPCINGEWRSAA